MELSVINSVVFGSLQPWQVDNLNEQTLYDILRNKHLLKSSTIGEVNNSLRILLRDHTSLHASLTKKLSGYLPSPFFIISPLKHFNITTEFYSLLLEYSAIEFLYSVIEEIKKTTDETEIYYIINTTLDRIKFIAAGAAVELKDQGFVGKPDCKSNTTLPHQEQTKQNTHFILFAAKQKVTQIFFDIQERFKPHAKAIETPEQFYLYTLNEAYQQETLLGTPAYFKWQIENLLIRNELEINEVLKILREVTIANNQEGLGDIITALENVIIANTFGIPIEHLQIAKLANSANYVEIVKQNITKQINQLTYGHERFTIITEALDKISSYKFTHSQNLILLSKLLTWLNIQAEAYKGNLSSSFAVTIEKNEKLSKGKPLPKEEKTAIEKNKQQAQEALTHFSGYNTQQRKIMLAEDYHRLLEYTYYLIEHEKLPQLIKAIPQIDLSANHIRYTYYLLHKTFYTTKEIKGVWIDFLQKVFTQLASQDWQTIKTKFSSKPNKYDSDLKQYEVI